MVSSVYLVNLMLVCNLPYARSWSWTRSHHSYIMCCEVADTDNDKMNDTKPTPRVFVDSGSRTSPSTRMYMYMYMYFYAHLDD